MLTTNYNVLVGEITIKCQRKSVIKMIRSWLGSSGPLLQAVALLLLPLAAARPDTGFTAFHPQVRLLDAMVDVQQVIIMLF